MLFPLFKKQGGEVERRGGEANLHGRGQSEILSATRE